MRRFSKLLVLGLVIGLLLMTVHIISAQQRGGRPGRGRRGEGGGGQIDPAAMMERIIGRRMENVTEGMQKMEIPADEATVLGSQIEALLRMRMAPNTGNREAIEELQKAIDEADNAQIKTKLDAIKATRKGRRAKDEKMEKELLEILPLKLEALLTVQGIVNGGGGGGFGGGSFGRGFGGGRGQRGPGGGRGGQRPQP